MKLHCHIQFLKYPLVWKIQRKKILWWGRKEYISIASAVRQSSIQNHNLDYLKIKAIHNFVLTFITNNHLRQVIRRERSRLFMITRSSKDECSTVSNNHLGLQIFLDHSRSLSSIDRKILMTFYWQVASSNKSKARTLADDAVPTIITIPFHPIHPSDIQL